LIVDAKGEFDQYIIAFGNNFKTKYDQLLEAYNGGQSAIVLIKSVTITPKGDWYLKAQHYTFLTKVVDEVIQARLLKLHNKLSSVQHALKGVNFFPILCIIQCFFQIYMKNIK